MAHSLITPPKMMIDWSRESTLIQGLTYFCHLYIDNAMRVADEDRSYMVHVMGEIGLHASENQVSVNGGQQLRIAREFLDHGLYFSDDKYVQEIDLYGSYGEGTDGYHGQTMTIGLAKDTGHGDDVPMIMKIHSSEASTLYSGDVYRGNLDAYFYSDIEEFNIGE